MIVTASSDALPDALPIGGLVRETDTGILRRTGELAWVEVARRIQLSRAAGSRMPEGTIKIDRSGKWGNPWRIEKVGGLWTVRHQAVALRATFPDEPAARHFAVTQVRQTLLRPQHGGLPFFLADVIAELRGRTVGCWCGLDRECHGDVYLELANA